MYEFVDKVRFEGLIAGILEIRQRLRCVKELMHQYRIFTYDNKECIIVETLPSDGVLTVLISYLDDYSKEIEVELNKFWDYAKITEYVLE